MRRVPKGKLTHHQRPARSPRPATWRKDNGLPHHHRHLRLDGRPRRGREAQSEGKQKPNAPSGEPSRSTARAQPKVPRRNRGKVQKRMLRADGHKVRRKRKRYFVEDFEKRLGRLDVREAEWALRRTLDDVSTRKSISREMDTSMAFFHRRNWAGSGRLVSRLDNGGVSGGVPVSRGGSSPANLFQTQQTFSSGGHEHRFQRRPARARPRRTSTRTARRTSSSCRPSLDVRAAGQRRRHVPDAAGRARPSPSARRSSRYRWETSTAMGMPT